MHKKQLLLSLPIIFLTLSVSVASAQSFMWQYQDGAVYTDSTVAENNPTPAYSTPSPSTDIPYSSQNYSSRSQTADIHITDHVGLRSLFQEHASVGADTLILRFDNDPQFPAASEALNKNTQALATEIGALYGSDVQSQFTNLWQEHNAQYIRYTDGLKGDTALKDDAKTKLDTIIEQLASLFDGKANVSRAELVDLFKNHVYFTRQILDMHATGNYRMQFEYGHVGFEHAAAMADALDHKRY